MFLKGWGTRSEIGGLSARKWKSGNIVAGHPTENIGSNGVVIRRILDANKWVASGEEDFRIPQNTQGVWPILANLMGPNGCWDFVEKGIVIG